MAVMSINISAVLGLPEIEQYPYLARPRKGMKSGWLPLASRLMDRDGRTRKSI